MFYSLKIIFKKSKPLLWYELYVPGGITFSTLSLFLDIASGARNTSRSDFVFDLPSYDVQLRESIFEDGSRRLDRQSLREADTTFIDEYMKKDIWFTYIPDKNEDTALRVEVKEISSRQLSLLPLSLGRCSRGALEIYEKDEEDTFKEKLEELMRYRLQKDEGFHFIKKKQLLEERGKKKDYYDRQKAGDPDYYVWVPEMSKPASKPDNSIPSLAEIARKSTRQILEAIGLKDFPSADGKALRQMLVTIYHENDLKELADQIGINPELPEDILGLFRPKERERVASLLLAKCCAERLLEREFMENRLLSVNDRQMETFRRAISEGGVFRAKSFEESDDLVRIHELNYAAATNNEDEFQIPTDVMETFKGIDRPEFHHKRQQHVWLLDCLDVVGYYYGSIPVREFYRLYRQFGELSRGEMVKEILSLSVFDSFCTVHDGRIIHRGWLHDDEYKSLEHCQGDKPYYIPTKEEVEDISWNGYPTRQKEIKTLLAFLQREMEMGEIDAKDLTEEIWHTLNQGENLHEVMELINEWELVFPSEQAMRVFLETITRLNNTTPLLYNRGFSPEALRPREMERIRRNGLTLVPGSSQAAGMLSEVAGQLRAMGVNIDLDSNAKEIDTAFISPDRRTVIAGKKKVYPNDPCPCGSGKKYKNCCGRKGK